MVKHAEQLFLGGWRGNLEEECKVGREVCEIDSKQSSRVSGAFLSQNYRIELEGTMKDI